MTQGLVQRGPRGRRGVLVGTVFLVPITMTPGLTLDPFNLPKLTVLMIGVVLALGIKVAEMADGVDGGGWKRMLVPAGAIVLPLSVAWMAGPYKEWSLFGLYYSYQGLIPYLLFAVLGLLIADSFTGRPYVLGVAMATSAAFVGSYALFQVAGLDPVGWSGYGVTIPGSSTIGNPNYSGAFLAINLPILIALSLLTRDRASRIAFAVLVIPVLGGLVVSDSQGAWVAGVAGTSIALGLALHKHWRHSKLVAAAAAFAAVLAVTSPVVLTMVVADRDWGGYTVRDRGWFWQAAAGMITAHPVLGRGPNAFAVEGVQYRPVAEGLEYNFEFTHDPHSLPFQLATSAGMLGFAGFMLLILWVLRRVQEWTSDQILRAGFLGGCVAYLVQSLVSVDEISLRLAFWSMLGGVAASMGGPLPSRRTRNGRGRRLRSPLLASTALLVVCAVGAVILFFWSDTRALAATRLADAGRQGAADAAYESASWLRDNYHYRQLRGAVNGARAVQGSSAEREQALATMESAFSYLDGFPDVLAMAEYAASLHRVAQGNRELEEKAFELFHRARRLDRVNPLIRVGEAEVLLALDRPEQAYQAISPLIYVFPQYSEYWGALALAEIATERFDVARESVALALSLDPRDERARRAEGLLEDL